MTKSISNLVRIAGIPATLRTLPKPTKLIQELAKMKIGTDIKFEVPQVKFKPQPFNPFPGNNSFKVETEIGMGSSDTQFIFKRQVHLTPEKPSIFKSLTLTEDHSGSVSLELNYKGSQADKLEKTFKNMNHLNFAHHKADENFCVWVNRDENAKIKQYVNKILKRNQFSEEAKNTIKKILKQAVTQKIETTSHQP